MTLINRLANNAQSKAWAEFCKNGSFDVQYGSLLVTYNDLGFHIDASDVDASDGTFCFPAGYVQSDGYLSDNFDVDESVFTALFPHDTAFFNTAESYHEFTVPPHETMAETMARVANTLVNAGFTWRPDWAN